MQQTCFYFVSIDNGTKSFERESDLHLAGCYLIKTIKTARFVWQGTRRKSIFFCTKTSRLKYLLKNLFKNMLSRRTFLGFYTHIRWKLYKCDYIVIRNEVIMLISPQPEDTGKFFKLKLQVLIYTNTYVNTASKRKLKL